MLHQRLPRPCHRGVSGWCQSLIQFAHGPWLDIVEPFLHRLPLGPRGRKVRGSVLPMTQCDRSDVKWHKKIYILSSCLHIFTLLYIHLYIYILFIRPMVYNGRLHFWRGSRGWFEWQILPKHLGHGYPRTPDTGDAGKGGQMQSCAAQAVSCQVFSLAAHPADPPDHWATEKDPQRKSLKKQCGNWSAMLREGDCLAPPRRQDASGHGTSSCRPHVADLVPPGWFNMVKRLSPCSCQGQAKGKDGKDNKGHQMQNKRVSQALSIFILHLDDSWFMYLFYLLPLDHLDAFGSTRCDMVWPRVLSLQWTNWVNWACWCCFFAIWVGRRLGVVLSCSDDAIHGRRIQKNTVTFDSARYLHQFSSLWTELGDVDGCCHGRQGQR